MKRLFFLIAVLAITASAAAQIKVLSNGNVGIGANNTNPTYKLDVIGAVKFSRPNWGYDHIYFEWGSDAFPRIYSVSPMWVGLENYPLWCSYVTYHYAKNSYNWSDERLKENIKPLGSTLDKLLQVEGKRFNFKKNENFDIVPEILESETFGLIAQELLKVFPELVSTPNSENGYYAVNYNGMIPVLLEAIKEQQTQIEKLQFILSKQSNEMTFLQERFETYYQSTHGYLLPQNMPTGENLKQNKGGKLFQNIPNPFNASTEIQFEIPENSTSARLLIHDMQGAEIRSYSITSKGAGNIIIQGSELQAGMYMYTLLVNNTIVDSKRMILPK